MRPGTTIDPSASTWAVSDVRSDNSMSVAARWSSPFSARSRTPPSTSTVVRVDTALETIASF
jgi:hypothetical protein